MGLELRRVAPADHHLLAGHEGRRRAARGGKAGAAAAPRGEAGGVVGHLDAVVAAVLDREGGVRRLDLERLARLHAAQIEGDVPLGHEDLEEVGLEGVERELGLLARAQVGPRSDLDLELRRLGGMELVASRERRVEARGLPVLGSGSEERDLAVDVREPRRRALEAQGVVQRGARGRARDEQAGEPGHCDPAIEAVRHFQPPLPGSLTRAARRGFRGGARSRPAGTRTRQIGHGCGGKGQRAVRRGEPAFPRGPATRTRLARRTELPRRFPLPEMVSLPPLRGGRGPARVYSKGEPA